MNTAHILLDKVKRGDLIQVANGFVIADTLSATSGSPDGQVEPLPFWYDTDGGRHFPTGRGTLVIGLAGFRTQDYGKVPGKDTKGHILLGAVPGSPPAGYCPASRNLGNRLSVWSSGTALTGVTCTVCRGMAGLVNVVKR